MQQFEAILEQSEKYKGGVYIIIPFNVKATFGKSRVQVKAEFDGVPYRGLIANMGLGDCLIVTKHIREKIGKTTGDSVNVTLEEDTSPRVVEVPPIFQTMLDKSPKAKAFFEKLSYTGRKEYVRWVSSAKKEETKERRRNKAIQMLLEGKKGV